MPGKRFLFLISLFTTLFPLLATSTNPISLQTPVVVFNTGDFLNTPVVSENADGFMIGCMDNQNFYSSFSADGISWNLRTPVFNNAYTAAWIKGLPTGFMATYIAGVPGFITATPVSVFSSDQGQSWGVEEVIVSISTVATPVVVTGNLAGFMATWFNTLDNNAYASFSTDNGLNWRSPVQITTSGLVFGTGPGGYNSAVIVSGTLDGFLATWLQSDSNAYASFSNNNGDTWSSPVQITHTGDVNSDVFVHGTSDGFMATWVDSFGNAYSSFSSDHGSSWSSPVSIASNLVINNLSSGEGANISVSGTVDGFVVAWIGQDDNGYVSFSDDHGATWTTPLAITTDNSVFHDNSDHAFGFVSVCVRAGSCVFSWLDSDHNIIASYSTFPGGVVPSTIDAPTNLTSVQKKNSFGLLYELFNVVQWEKSPSVDAIGYYVYCNGVKVATLDAFTLQYIVHNQKRGVTTVYEVTAFNADGVESAPATTQLN